MKDLVRASRAAGWITLAVIGYGLMAGVSMRLEKAVWPGGTLMKDDHCDNASMVAASLLWPVVLPLNGVLYVAYQVADHKPKQGCVS